MKQLNILSYFLITFLLACNTAKNPKEEGSAKVESADEKPQSTHPVWSPDGSQIAFIDNTVGIENNTPVNFEVYTMNGDGTQKTRHTFNQAFEADISWSPDGSKLAVKSYRDNNDEVYIIDLISKEQTNISNHQGSDGSPIWKSNEEIIFLSKREQENGELYVYNLNNTTINRLTNNEIREGSATLSPAGDKIVFVSNHDGDDDIYIMDLTGENLTQLTNNELNDWYPQWSPNGEEILYTYGDWDTDIWELRSINVKDKNEKTLIKNTDSGNASWRPNGVELAFASSKSGFGEIYIFDTTTHKEVKITDH